MNSYSNTNEVLPPTSQTTEAEKADGTQAEEDKWDEEELEKAMNTLKEQHIQLRELRTTIARVMAPLATKHPSPEALFREFSTAKNNANLEVQQFRKLMEGPESEKVAKYAQKSRSERPKGIKPWSVTEHPDWATRDPPA